MESDSEGVDDDEEIFQPKPSRKRRRPAVESEDEFEDDGVDVHVSEDEGISRMSLKKLVDPS